MRTRLGTVRDRWLTLRLLGTAVGQIAKLLGAGRVIGYAGSDEKVALLTEKYGNDVGFTYKDGPVREQLAAAAPEGIEVFFDTVGGEYREAALDAFNDGGRAVLCGAISSYNAIARPTGPGVPREDDLMARRRIHHR